MKTKSLIATNLSILTLLVLSSAAFAENLSLALNNVAFIRIENHLLFFNIVTKQETTKIINFPLIIALIGLTETFLLMAIRVIKYHQFKKKRSKQKETK